MRLESSQVTYLLAGLKDDMATLAKLLEDPIVEDVARNADGTLWVKRLGCEWTTAGFLAESAAISIVATIARLQGLELTHEKPFIESVIPGCGHRIEALCDPLSTGTVLSIRKRALMIYMLNDYVRDGIMTEQQAESLRRAILAQKSILVSGSTGSGKTTLLNALFSEMAELCPHDRIVVMEETPELQCAIKNSVMLTTSMDVPMNGLLCCAMRLRPTRIIVGEVRGPEALEMLKAFNTGHPGGLSTIHANQRGAIQRLQDLVREAIANYDALPLIREAIDLVVHIDGPQAGRGRKVTEFFWIKDEDQIKYGVNACFDSLHRNA